jgi:hypothetical protein
MLQVKRLDISPQVEFFAFNPGIPEVELKKGLSSSAFCLLKMSKYGFGSGFDETGK